MHPRTRPGNPLHSRVTSLSPASPDVVSSSPASPDVATAKLRSRSRPRPRLPSPSLILLRDPSPLRGPPCPPFQPPPREPPPRSPVPRPTLRTLVGLAGESNRGFATNTFFGVCFFFLTFFSSPFFFGLRTCGSCPRAHGHRPRATRLVWCVVGRAGSGVIRRIVCRWARANRSGRSRARAGARGGRGGGSKGWKAGRERGRGRGGGREREGGA